MAEQNTAPEKAEILIVEDSISQANQLKFILEANGFSVAQANNGQQAVELLKVFKPSIVISDVLMPEMNGYELCERIKQSPETKDIPVILLTALSNPNDVIRGLQSGADNFITKPYNRHFLMSRIEYIMLNKEIRKNNISGTAVEIMFAGNKYIINSDRMQIIDLLLSTYENAIQKNDELASANHELTIIHRELEQKNRELEKLNQEKNKFLGMAAHDLRNPLGLINGFSSFILEEAGDNLSKTHSDFLNIIQSSSESMLLMVNDLLDIALIESGKLELRKEKIYLTAFIDQIVSLNNVFAIKKKIQLNFQHDDSRPVTFCDPGKIQQVVTNLISNSLKYSESGSSVDINLSSNKSEAIIFVKDHGRGIPERDKDKLFKPFSRAGVKSTAGEKSTGLGLMIARIIIEGHRGKIWFESVEGTGSTFYILLPLNNE
ncbi:MAG: hybrid sensor histidine kinase/response regulator [Ignavibacteriaceae bacterium]|nr:hybrid sensor histidine kinase/response regulator [Ignavibacteriaceae bacterium]